MNSKGQNKTNNDHSRSAVIMAGGTGGHIFPGLALAKALKDQSWQVDWIGTADRMEADIVPKYDVPIHFIEVKGVRGNGLKRLIKAPLMLINAFFQARKVFKTLKPNVVVGFGGYASGPGGIAAWSLGIPLIVHEQNAVAGMTNRWLGKIANKVLLAFPNAIGAFKQNKTEVIGNPVREDIAQLNQVNKRQLSPEDTIRIAIIGGSLGARILNQQLPDAFHQLLNKGFKLQVHHQVGKGNKHAVSQAYAEIPALNGETLDVTIDEFIDDMPAVLSWADLVICRAGALTVSELDASSNVGVYIPLPHAVDDHQTANANWLVQANAGLLIEQQQIKQKLVVQLTELLSNPEQINQMQVNAKQQAILTTTDRMVTLCKEMESNN